MPEARITIFERAFFLKEMQQLLDFAAMRSLPPSLPRASRLTFRCLYHFSTAPRSPPFPPFKSTAASRRYRRQLRTPSPARDLRFRDTQKRPLRGFVRSHTRAYYNAMPSSFSTILSGRSLLPPSHGNSAAIPRGCLLHQPFSPLLERLARYYAQYKRADKRYFAAAATVVVVGRSFRRTRAICRIPAQQQLLAYAILNRRHTATSRDAAASCPVIAGHCAPPPTTMPVIAASAYDAGRRPHIA